MFQKLTKQGEYGIPKKDFVSQANFEQAFEVLEKAYALNPYNWRICHMRLNVMLRLNKVENRRSKSDFRITTRPRL